MYHCHPRHAQPDIGKANFHQLVVEDFSANFLA
jgi:hypothetical protein